MYIYSLMNSSKEKHFFEVGFFLKRVFYCPFWWI